MRIKRRESEGELDIYDICDDGIDADGDGAETPDDEPAETPVGDFTVGDESYSVRYNKGRVMLYERAVSHPIMATFAQDGGTLSLNDLQTLLAFGLCVTGGRFVQPKEAQKMAGRLLENNGYFAVYETVMEALSRDCGFLFRGMGAF